ncbi:MAG: thiol:disulfide interchange protein DsbA [Lentisphaeria bacterium]|jgi:thiol:disulfide interchange protein DsbA
MRILAIAFGLLASLAACAQDNNQTTAAPEAAGAVESATYVEGVDYKKLSTPVRTITPGKIEVTEAFAYTCGHCFHFEPLLQAWKKQLGEDVELVRLPVIWRPNMQLLARIMYTGKALKMSEALDARVFNLFHVEKKSVDSEGTAGLVFKALGVDEQTFKKTFNSFGVSSQVQQADARTRSMQITGTPQLIVDGRYSVSATKTLGHQGMLKVANFLIEKVRAEQQ